MKRYDIAVLPGDGIGPEVTEQAVLCLEQAGRSCGFEVSFECADIGGCAIDRWGEPLPQSTVELCRASNAVLMGAVGGSKWDGLPGDKRPEAGLLGIRKALGLYANLRPALVFEPLLDASPLRREVIGGALDVMVVRELTGGIYFGERGRTGEGAGQSAFDTERYSAAEIDRIARVGFEQARDRRRRLCSVDKANVLESSRLWRERVTAMSAEYPDVELRHMYVDNCAMQLVRDPSQFDVIVTSNMFGDILSDEASMITGSIGMLPSASMGEGSFGLYEPVHGSAPDIAGTGRANPCAAILSAAMLLRCSLGQAEAADALEAAVSQALSLCRTADLCGEGEAAASCGDMGGAIRQVFVAKTL